MRYYETTFIARQDLGQNQVDGLVKHFSDLLKENGGQIKYTESWGLRQLAYKINKNKKGHYCFLALEAAPEAVQEMERQMRLHEDVLRYLSIKVEALPESPTAMLKERLRDEQKARTFDVDDEPAGGYRRRESHDAGSGRREYHHDTQNRKED